MKFAEYREWALLDWGWNSINTLKSAIFDLIQRDINNRLFNNVNKEVFNENLVLYHRPAIDFSKKIEYKDK